MRRFPNREWIYATPAQENYIKILQREAFVLLCTPLHLDRSRRILKSEASKIIDTFKTAIAAAKEKRNVKRSARHAVPASGLQADR